MIDYPKLRFLADVNIEKRERVVDSLVAAGFDVKWVAEEDCSITDEALLDTVRREGRILLTDDKDFGQLVFLQKKATQGLILLRVGGQDVRAKARLLDRLVKEFGDRIQHHFVVVTDKKFRFISLEATK